MAVMPQSILYIMKASHFDFLTNDVKSSTDSIFTLLTNTDVSQEYANSGYKKVSDSFSIKSSTLNHDKYWLDF